MLVIANKLYQYGAGFTEVRASLREIPEDVSVRKPPLKEKARRQRSLTLENDEVVGRRQRTLTLENDEVVGRRQRALTLENDEVIR